MSKLLARLMDPEKSGVYHASRGDDIRQAVSGTEHDLVSIELPQGKEQMLDSIAKALGFPDWFGRNWDALEDCLSDLHWRPGSSTRILLLSGAVRSEDSDILVDVLTSVAEFWRQRRHPFFAVFVDRLNALGLPQLYKQAP